MTGDPLELGFQSSSISLGSEALAKGRDTYWGICTLTMPLANCHPSFSVRFLTAEFSLE